MEKISIVHYAAPPIVGGVESTIFHHSRLLVEAGFSVDVIAGRGEEFEHKVGFHEIPSIDSRHPEVLSIGEELSQGIVSQNFYDLRDLLIRSLKTVLLNSDLCIVHNVITLHKNLPLTAAIHAISEEELLPIISWSHDFAWSDDLYTSDLHDGYPWDLLRMPWRGVRHVVVSTHRRALLAQLLNISEGEIKVITPGVDICQFFRCHPLTQEIFDANDLAEADPLILVPARLTRRKNIQFALRVTAALRENKQKVRLIITGPPGPHNPSNMEYLEELQALKNELGMEGHVIFFYELGKAGVPLHAPDEVLTDLYMLCDLLLFPSFREGFGIPVLEADLTRLPVFASDIPPIRESGGEFTELINPDGDPADVAKRISEFLSVDNAYQLKKCVVAKYTWQSIITKQLIPFAMEVIADERR